MDPKQNQPDQPKPDDRQAAANVVRHQIDQIYINDQGAMSTQQNASDQPQQLQQPVNPYQQTHAPTSDTANLGNNDKQSAPAENRAEAERKYHSAWQNYYQKYYEKYYIAQMQSQKQRFEEQRALVVRDNDETKVSDILTQDQALNELRHDLLSKVKQNAGKIRRSRHFWPIVSAATVILLAAFIQFNQLIFANVSAFVAPGAISQSNIIVGTGDNQPVGPNPEIIIPKINVEAPVIYGLPSLDEATTQNALKGGVVHYPIPGANSYPGQNGNTVILGHSSSDIFNDGQFKFIFVQLGRLEPGDLFYLNYNNVRYTYQVTSKEIIAPDQVGKLAIGDDKPYATLITCDPPGTALRRLIVYGEQINPDPNQAKAPAPATDTPVVDSITGNPPTLFEMIFGGR